MINLTLLWFILLPLALAVGVWYFCGRGRDGAVVAGLYALASVVVIASAFAITHGVATADTEIWNGQVTAKERVHGTYEQSYDCFCTTDSKGNRSCQTCYETHYTAKWTCDTTIGGYTIDSIDTTSRIRRDATPNPQRWTIIQPGDPVSKRHSYTNYVQAVPQTLFRPVGASLKARFAPLLPAYPDQVYDIYRNDKFLTPGYSTPDVAAWNAGLNELLKVRGPRKQVNAIVVIAKTDDANYAYALQDAWEGVNKNDVVLVIGSTQWPKIDFVSVLSWTKNELFKVQLRDEVQALGSIQREKVLEILGRQIDTQFERRHMSEFKYLSGEIDPPLWVLVLVGLLVAGGAPLAWFLYNRQFNSRRPYRRF